MYLRRPHSLLAVLLVVDRYSVASAFGGLRVGVTSGSRFGSADGEGLRQLLGDWARRVLLQPRCATLAPATDAGEGQVLSRWAVTEWYRAQSNMTPALLTAQS